MLRIRILTGLIVILTLAIPPAESRGNKRLPVQSFDGMETLMDFEVEGISLNTPKDDVAGILEANGYSLYSDNGSIRVFTKGVLGQGHVGIAGEVGYVMQVMHRDQQTAIYFYRPAPQVTHMEARNRQPGPIPDTIDAKEGARVRAMICENLTDPTEQHRLCRPPTELELGFGSTIKLVLRRNPLVTVSVDIRGHTGQIEMVSYH